MTGQVPFDRYVDAGVLVSVELVNGLASRRRADTAPTRDEALALLSQALTVDPTSVEQLQADADAGLAFVALAQHLRAVFDDLDRGDPDAAASRLNDLLATHPAHPYLAKEQGRWRLHHHGVDAALVPMWTAICAEGLARLFGAGRQDRLGTCAAVDCRRAFVDGSKNASRRFCSTTCQNRVKAAAFRQRRAADRA